jgi:guanosine-3',5'-bis(diphosphate) 3'-pyrophosphohydrolase
LPHPISLARTLTVEGGVTDTLVLTAAILHDTIEDTDTTYEELRARFGRTVADVVREVTDDNSLPKAQRKQAQIDNAPRASKRAALVKLADKIVNLRDMDANPPAAGRRRRASTSTGPVGRSASTDEREAAQGVDQAYARRP